MSAGVAARPASPRMGPLVLLGAALIAVAFGAAFAAGKLTGDDSEAAPVRQATPIEQPSAKPELPAVPPAVALPPLKEEPAPEAGGGAPAPPTDAPTPAPAPAPDGGGGGGGTIIEG